MQPSFSPNGTLIATRTPTLSSEMNDFGKKSKKSCREEKLTYIYNAAPLFIRHLCKFNASVLSFRDKQKFSCKTATVTFSFPCLRA